MPDAVVKSVKEMMERVQYIQEEFDSPALIEEYIEGREIYAGDSRQLRDGAGVAAGGTRSVAAAEGTPKIASYDVKFEKNTEAYKLTKSAVAGRSGRRNQEAPDRDGARRISGAETARLWTHRYASGAERRRLCDRGQSESVALERAGICHGRQGLRAFLYAVDRQRLWNWHSAARRGERPTLLKCSIASSSTR